MSHTVPDISASLHRAAAKRVRTAESLATHARFRSMSAVVKVMGRLGAEPHACRAAGALNVMVLASSLLHAQPAYEWEGDFGEDGAWLRTLCAWYEHKVHHTELKAKVGRDILLSGVGEALLLLRWADIDAAADKWAVHIGRKMSHVSPHRSPSRTHSNDTPRMSIVEWVHHKA